MKKNILILLVSIFLILPFRVGAIDLEKGTQVSLESTDSSFNMIYDYDDNGNVCGYLIYNTSYSSEDSFTTYIKVGLDSKMSWNKNGDKITDFDVSVVNNDLLIKRINSNTGDVLWEKTFGGKLGEYLNKVFNSYDDNGKLDGVIIYFTTESFELYEPGTYEMKYDLSGNLLWMKKMSSNSLKNSNNEWIRVSTNGPIHGMYEVALFNLNTNTAMYPISVVSSGLPYYMFVNASNENVVVYKTYNNPVVKISRMSSDNKVLLTKEINNTFIPYSIVNSKNYDGSVDGLIIASNEGVVKVDNDFNEVSSFDLSYTVNRIIESRDSNGDFNGYVMIGSNGSKLLLTSFTYPKRVIESKNTDVEVMDGAYPGKTVTLIPKEKEGYIVKRVIVRDSSGKEIEVSNDNTFVMPDDDVSIEVIYEKRETEPVINPNTSSTISVILVLVSIIIFGTVLIRVTVLNKSI